MNSRDPIVRPTEMAASALESFGGQKVTNEVYAKARELRRWLAAHPGSTRNEMPADLRDQIWFLLSRKLAARDVGHGNVRRYSVQAL